MKKKKNLNNKSQVEKCNMLLKSTLYQFISHPNTIFNRKIRKKKKKKILKYDIIVSFKIQRGAALQRVTPISNHSLFLLSDQRIFACKVLTFLHTGARKSTVVQLTPMEANKARPFKKAATFREARTLCIQVNEDECASVLACPSVLTTVYAYSVFNNTNVNLCEVHSNRMYSCKFTKYNNVYTFIAAHRYITWFNGIKN